MAQPGPQPLPRWAVDPQVQRTTPSKLLIRLQHVFFAAALIIFVVFSLSFARSPSDVALQRSATHSSDGNDILKSIADAISKGTAAGPPGASATNPADAVDEDQGDEEDAEDDDDTEIDPSAWPNNVPCAHTKNGTFTNTTCLLDDGRRPALLYHSSRPHLEVFSKMSNDGRRFLVDFGTWDTHNVNILPHPTEPETWVVIANLDGIPDYRYQLVCNAEFVDNTMKCKHSPLNLPVTASFSPVCEGLNFGFNWIVGPSDARAFYGPEHPYVIWGAPGEHACLSQWMHDLRRLWRWGHDRFVDPGSPLFYATELQRVPPYGQWEKNYFVFWDKNGSMYVHNDISPRVFAKLNASDGSVGENLAPLAKTDRRCMAKLMPKLLPTEFEHNHQATNSLSITMCERADPECKPTDDNTFIFFIFQTKTNYLLPGFYEPFVMMINQAPPFQVHGISKAPLWYAGRGRAGEMWREDDPVPQGESELLYTTSFAWKTQNMTYHGYLDDDIFIGMGIMDRQSAVIDVVAKDLLANIAYCKDVL